MNVKEYEEQRKAYNERRAQLIQRCKARRTLLVYTKANLDRDPQLRAWQQEIDELTAQIDTINVRINESRTYKPRQNRQTESKQHRNFDNLDEYEQRVLLALINEVGEAKYRRICEDVLRRYQVDGSGRISDHAETERMMRNNYNKYGGSHV